MKINRIRNIIFSLLTLAPSFAFTAIPVRAAEPADVDARAYVVLDNKTGKTLYSKNANMAWTPASLTKLVTALVVLDTKPNLNKQFAISSYDQSLGACGKGGTCIKTKPGVKYTVDGLFNAALLPSANNATSALARSTGLTPAQFAARMNKKAKQLGATHSKFYEPTGISSRNVITAADYAKIVKAAFAYPYLRKVAQRSTFALRSTNNRNYNQTVRNTNALLASDEVTTLGAKTGYLGSKSGYNFGTLIKTSDGRELVVVVLGEKHMYTAYSDTKAIARAVSGNSLAMR